MAENEADIHCNVIQCRKSLGFDAKACVTSCSHIFCLECANRAFPRALVCPACDTQLNQSDDIVVTQLNPSEEYKSSVLAGLRPDVVMDICSRAIAFYQYQTSQELCFRSMVQKNLEMKANALQAQLNDLIQDAARHLKVEKEKSAMIQRDQEADKGRLHEVQAQLQDKTKQFHKLQATSPISIFSHNTNYLGNVREAEEKNGHTHSVYSTRSISSTCPAHRPDTFSADPTILPSSISAKFILDPTPGVYCKYFTTLVQF
ncbi:hypothetical protein CLU79DRAFT_740521 [Phycomyces nitens]|nr:hypothetical protein CLU79DRAFT_740521 [Phycomyces nitens]